MTDEHVALDRQMVDAIRELLGMGPLYRVEKKDPYYKSWRFVVSDGNRRRCPRNIGD